MSFPITKRIYLLEQFEGIECEKAVKDLHGGEFPGETVWGAGWGGNKQPQAHL